MDRIDAIVRAVLERLAAEGGAKQEGAADGLGAPASGTDASAGCAERRTERPVIPAELSARHVHLSEEDLQALFGVRTLEKVRDISQPGQFLSTLRLRLIGPKGVLENVAVLGPPRRETQVEISATDARALGIQPPVRMSGDLRGAARVTLQAGEAFLSREAAIIARRHLHMTPPQAACYGLRDGQRVSVRVCGTRPLVLEDVAVRVTDASALALHIDADEANAAGVSGACTCELVGACTGRDAGEQCAEAACFDQAAACSFEGKALTEQVLRTLAGQGAQKIVLRRGQLVTPLARDTAKSLHITLEAPK